MASALLAIEAIGWLAVLLADAAVALSDESGNATTSLVIGEFGSLAKESRTRL